MSAAIRTLMGLMLAAVVLATGCSGAGTAAQAGAAAEPAAALADACCDAPAAADDAAGGDGRRDSSDLDRSVAELLAARCEHEMPAHRCPECRYEVGMVEAVDALFDGRDGALRTAVLGAAALPIGKDLNGEVGLNEARAVSLAPPASGVVMAIHADLGARVGRGDVLFEVESADFRNAKAAYRRAWAAEELAVATERRERELHERKISPRKDVEEAEAVRRQARAEREAAAGLLIALGVPQAELPRMLEEGGAQSGLMPVRAPFAGMVLERSLSLGANIGPGERALLLADTAEAWVTTTLPERDLAALLEAQRRGVVSAEVRVEAYPNRTFAGAVTALGGTIDAQTRSGRARVVVPNPDGLLRAGMFARVRLLLEAAAAAVAVPSEAVLEDEGREFVFVRLEGPLFVRRPVRSVREAAGWTEIDGLKAGEEVVTAGAFLLKSDVLRAKMGAGCAD